MKVDLKQHTCIVTQEPGDPRFYGIAQAKGESRLLYHVKKILNAQGNDFVKTRMHKDGHLVDDLQQYLKTRSRNSPGEHAYIYNDRWAIAGAEEYLNRDGVVILTVIRNIWEDSCSST